MRIWIAVLFCFLININILNLANAENSNFDPKFNSKEQIAIIDNAVKKLNANFDANDSIINWMPELNLYKVLSRKDLEVFFISKDGRYFFYGDVIDLKQDNKFKRNITDSSKKEVRRKVLLGFSKNDMLIFKPDHKSWGLRKPLAVITVFTDLNCPYGNRLHKEVEKAVLEGLEVRYLFFPRSGIDSDGYKKAVSVWCSRDRKKAFISATEGQTPDVHDCKNNPIKAQWELARKLGIQATPSILLNDGSLIPGYIESNALITMVKDSNAHSHSG